MRTKNDNYFANINTEHKAYLLGFIAADGYVCNKPGNKSLTICLAEKDREILDIAKSQFGYDGDLYLRHMEANTSLRLRVYGDIFVNNLIHHGFDNLKTYRFHLPQIPERFYKDFIRGYFDGDGCIHFSKRKGRNKYRYAVTIMGAESFCRELNGFIKKTIGISFSETPIKTLRNINIMSLRTERILDIKQFLKYIYDGSSVFLTRKWKKHRELLKIHDEHNQEKRKLLTAENILEIRQRIKTGEVLRSIAKDYGVTHGAIGGIKNGTSYSYVK